ncbi:MAG: hypothetical protein WCD44_01705 [Candidatus Babeliales bacterium]
MYITIEKNDIYILKIIDSNILINNDYQGISIFNSNLEKVKDIFIFEDLAIYSIYKNFIDKKVLLYCPDNECIVYVNLNTFDVNIISLPNQNIIFSSIYYWQKNLVVLTTYTSECYILDVEKRIIKEISKKKIAKNYSVFYSFWIESKNYSILKVYSQKLEFVFDDPNYNRIGLFKFKQNEKFFIKKPTEIGHDIECKNNKFMFINENKIIFLSEKKVTSWEAKKNEIFLRAKFLDINSIIILSSSKKNCKNNTINKFTII